METIKKYAYDADAPSLCEAYKDYFKVGAAITTRHIEEGTPECAMLLKQFNIFTLDNESKPLRIHPEEDRYEFERFDKFVEFGEKHGVTLRGHTLVWHNSCPDWFFYDKDGNTVSEDVLIARMTDHIKTVVSRYRGRIRTWDVVNEVISHQGGGFRDSMWYKIAGKRFIKEAFRAAHEADPDARLLINDYNVEEYEEKADSIYELVREMLEEGIPVHGMGLQMHRYLIHDTPPETLKRNIRKVVGLREIAPDFKFEVTEMDITCYRWDDKESEDVAWTEELHAQFSAQYVEWFKFFKELSDEGALDSVLFWGIHDGNSWLNGFPVRHKNYPLLIGREFVLKDAYYDVLALAEKK